MMTCKPAVGLSIFLLVAFNTESHLKIYRLKTVLCPDITVTFHAIQVCPFDMGLVPEFYKIGHIKYLNPLYRIPAFKMLKLLHQLGMRGDYILVTEKAFLHYRDSCLP